MDLTNYMLKCQLSIAIVGNKYPKMLDWDKDNIKTGLPGSEEAVVYSSELLAERGHTVKIFISSPLDSKYRTCNPQWLSLNDWYNTTETFDLVLMWRCMDYKLGSIHGKKVFFWSHDSPVISPIYNIFPKFDGVCLLSNHHWKQFSLWPGFFAVPSIISGNGVVLSQFQRPISFTNPYSIGYFSNYSRGLHNLLVIWPEIKKLYPRAVLKICYGRETWNTMSPNDLEKLINKIKLYEMLDVIECGKVGHEELSEIMQETSIWAYPCNFFVSTETFCITAVKCQLAGCIPVITRSGALLETVHPDAPSVSKCITYDEIQDYKQILLSTLARIENPEIYDERQKYISFAKQFTWDNCINNWLSLYHSLIKNTD